ncbi:hypothetical protein MNEG_13257, partial [Monoraphidium neglectum]
AVVMKALVGLCTVLYKSFPTSIQQDTKLLAKLDAVSASSSSSGSGSSSSDGSMGGGGGGGAAAEEEREGLRAAVAYRLVMKRGLEGATRRLLLRMKELLG